MGSGSLFGRDRGVLSGDFKVFEFLNHQQAMLSRFEVSNRVQASSRTLLGHRLFP